MEFFYITKIFWICPFACCPVKGSQIILKTCCCGRYGPNDFIQTPGMQQSFFLILPDPWSQYFFNVQGVDEAVFVQCYNSCPQEIEWVFEQFQVKCLPPRIGTFINYKEQKNSENSQFTMYHLLILYILSSHNMTSFMKELSYFFVSLQIWLNLIFRLFLFCGLFKSLKHICSSYSPQSSSVNCNSLPFARTSRL